MKDEPRTPQTRPSKRYWNFRSPVCEYLIFSVTLPNKLQYEMEQRCCSVVLPPGLTVYLHIGTCNFHIRTAQHLDIIKVFYSPTEAQVNCLKNSIKIYIKTAPTFFGAGAPGSGRAFFVVA
jgi:hypothetical protein